MLLKWLAPNSATLRSPPDSQPHTAREEATVTVAGLDKFVYRLLHTLDGRALRLGGISENVKEGETPREGVGHVLTPSY